MVASGLAVGRPSSGPSLPSSPRLVCGSIPPSRRLAGPHHLWWGQQQRPRHERTTL